MKTCPDCNGDGVIDKGTDDEKQCPTCGGSGFMPDDNDDNNNEEIIRTTPRLSAKRIDLAYRSGCGVIYPALIGR
jgi:RecJ-like exonuclease